MELLDLYTNTVEGLYTLYRKYVFESESQPADTPRHDRRNRILWGWHGAEAIQLLDALRGVEGPRKWARDDHGTLIILPVRHIRVREQVKVQVWGRSGYQVAYWLPTSGWPWEQCSSTTFSALEAARLIVDALGKCEQELIPRRGPEYELEKWVLEDIAAGRNGDGDTPTPPWLE